MRDSTEPSYLRKYNAAKWRHIRVRHRGHFPDQIFDSFTTLYQKTPHNVRPRNPNCDLQNTVGYILISARLSSSEVSSVEDEDTIWACAGNHEGLRLIPMLNIFWINSSSFL